MYGLLPYTLTSYVGEFPCTVYRLSNCTQVLCVYVCKRIYIVNVLGCFCRFQIFQIFVKCTVYMNKHLYN